MLKIYNTLTKKKELFKYKKKHTIKIYVCGPTVYTHCHVGHARIFIFFDILIRYLKYLGLNILYIRNITDVDDKIINKALSHKKSIKTVTEVFIKNLHKDTTTLNIIEPTFEPKATTFIPEMIKTINTLYKKKYAYRKKNGDICFNTKNFPHYGILSKNLIKTNLKPINTHDNKNSHLDFALWKITKQKKYSWTSPWGLGRPGWHTECSTMIAYYFKKGIDIHGGGKDLLFPHHENELAQYKTVNTFNLSKIWIHTGFIKLNKKKMSKSLKNTILIKNLLKKIDSEYLRYFILSTHYRNDIEFSLENLNNTKKSLQNLYKILLKHPTSSNYIKESYFKNLFLKAINDDFNTPKAISILFEILNKITKTKNLPLKTKINLIISLKYLGNILGLLKHNPKTFLKKNHIKTKHIAHINVLIKKRDIARKLKNWTLADNIRKKLKTYNIKLEDSKTETNFF